eukprot:jgi/Mesen1/10818/ME000093S10331
MPDGKPTEDFAARNLKASEMLASTPFETNDTAVAAGTNNSSDTIDILATNTTAGVNTAVGTDVEATPPSEQEANPPVQSPQEGGAPNSTSVEREKRKKPLSAWILGDPYVSLVWAGVLLDLLGIAGLWGAVTANNQVLFGCVCPLSTPPPSSLCSAPLCSLLLSSTLLYASPVPSLPCFPYCSS